ncbi:MAG: prepilin-type N-terminal cleavage/methylation domain-containing protein [Acidobacteria bacterium]|nr:prepilin-type N-terminal cleavage/methylation domain-containing protein [Acidobacteriota bacterium]
MVKRAFTLLEILIVLSLVALLAGLAGFTHRNRVRKAQENVLRHNLSMMRLTLDAYHQDKGHFPDSLQTLVDEGYLREMPLDPVTKSHDSWVPVFEENYGDEDSSYEPGLWDIHSGSEETALDGTPYNEW